MAVKLQKDPEGLSAVDVGPLQDDHPELVDNVVAVDTQLEKRNLAGMRGQVVVLLDHSGSMRRDYGSGAVQKLLLRALAFSLNIDADGTVPVVAYDDRTRDPINVTVDNYRTVVDTQIWDRDRMGTTDMAGAFRKLRAVAEATDEIIVALNITDGNPDDKRATTEEIVKLSGLPVFIKNLALRPVPYLQEIDDLPANMRVIDNVDSKPEMGSSLDLLSCTDDEFAHAMTDEWDSWLAAAQAANIVGSP